MNFIFNCKILQLLCTVSNGDSRSDTGNSDPGPQWSKMLDPNPQWIQCEFTTLSTGIDYITISSAKVRNLAQRKLRYHILYAFSYGRIPRYRYVHCSINCFSFLSFEPVFHLGCLPISSTRTQLKSEWRETCKRNLHNGRQGRYRRSRQLLIYRTCYTPVRSTRVPANPRDSLFYETKL